MKKPLSSTTLSLACLDANGQKSSLQSLLGKYVVLYFYPRDNTPGCTKEACSFRDFNTEIQKLGAVVVGVSKDSVSSHLKFAEKHHLNFPLWSDPDHTLIEALGAWGEKKFMGKTYMGILRSTFVINPKGAIIREWREVKPENHAQEVYEFLRSEVQS